MKKVSFFKRALAVAVAATMLLSFDLPTFASENVMGDGITFEQVDNSLVEAALALEDSKVVETATETYDNNDVVRVSIVLKQDSVIDAGYSTEDILNNSAALKHMNNVKNNQKKVQKELAKAAKKGLKVKKNLSIVANVISAEVTYGDIKNIEAISEVKEVVIETQYDPCEGSVVSSPLMAVSTGNMTGAAQSWAEGYKGAGARIAIVDTGLDIDHQSFNNDAFMYALKQDVPVITNKNNKNNKSNNGNGKGNNKKNNNATEEVTYDFSGLNLLGAEEIAKALPYLNAGAILGDSVSAEDFVISEKIPFGFNYVDGNLNVRHIYDTQGEHGSHVAGISAANRYIKSGDTFVDALKEVGVAGNAPDAQVLVMKVFGQGGGAYDSDYMAAIEDAIVLGCDSVNLSLGSGNAGLATSATYQEILNKLCESDTVVVMSAGNSGAWAENTTYGDLYADGVNFDTAGSPGSFTNSLSVASVDNIGTYGNSFKVADKAFGYTETSGYGNAPLETLADGASADYEYVFIEGFGEASDFDGVDVAGKVVFVSRGTISFFEKGNNAVSNGAVATIVYNNQPGSISMNLDGYTYSAPCVSITQEQGEMIKAASAKEGNVYTGTISFNHDKSVMLSGSDHYTMSSFSSWGIPGNLSMKPEITAPGGSIWSANGTNNAGGGVDQYELMSGTSMAAPQITGMVAVLKRFIELNGLTQAGMSNRALAQSLLMSTATPMKDADGYYYSVLQQGAGLGNVNDAMHASSYITMNSDATVSAKDGKVKVELGEDPERTGVYNFSFNISNISNEHLTYKLSADVFTQAVAQDEDVLFLLGETMDVPASVTFTVDGKKASSVTVKKKKSAKVNVSIALDDEIKEFFDEYLTGGAYVEAYVYAEPTNGSSVHSIPVLGFYGSFTDSSMYDIGSYIDYKFGLETRAPYLYANNSTRGNAFTVNFGDGSGEFYFGGNLFANETEYHPEFMSLNNQNGDAIKAINYALIRNAGAMAVTVTDKNTGDVYVSRNMGSQYGAYYYTNGSTWRNTTSKVTLNWTGTDASGNKLPEGTEVEISLIAVPEYYCDAEGKFDVTELHDGAFLSTSLTIDNTAPEMIAISDDENGMIGVVAEDNVGIAAVMLFSNNGRTLIGRAAVGADGMAEWLASDLADDIYLVSVVDYAGNMSTYRVFLNMELTDEVEAIELSNSSLVLMKNNSTTLTATVTPDNIVDDTVIWTTSDESVAVVNEEGKVTAVGVGSCVITATSVLDTEKSASCDVTVIEINAELNGVVWDEEGAVWFSQINTANLPNYTKLASFNAPINNLAYGSDGLVYASDIDTEEGLSNLYTMNPATGELSMIGASSIAYTDMASAPSLGNVLLATYFNYIVIVDPVTGDYAGAFNYLPSGELVGISYAGSVLNTYYNQYIDFYYLLDSDGNLYSEAFMPYNGSYAYFNGADDALLGNTGVTCDTPYFQSLYFNGEYTFASCYNESKNSVTLYAIDSEATGAVYALGDFADGVWPVAALCEMTTGDTVSAKAAAFSEATVKEAELMRVPTVFELNVRK